MREASGPGFNSQWRTNIFNYVLFTKACERERIHLTMLLNIAMEPYNMPKCISREGYIYQGRLNRGAGGQSPLLINSLLFIVLLKWGMC